MKNRFRIDVETDDADLSAADVERAVAHAVEWMTGARPPKCVAKRLPHLRLAELAAARVRVVEAYRADPAFNRAKLARELGVRRKTVSGWILGVDPGAPAKRRAALDADLAERQARREAALAEWHAREAADLAERQARKDRVLSMLGEGIILDEIAEAEGVTRQRISQLLKKWGVDGKAGLRIRTAARAEARAKAKADAKAARAEAKAARRASALKMIESGMTNAEVARRLGVHGVTVGQWARDAGFVSSMSAAVSRGKLRVASMPATARADAAKLIESGMTYAEVAGRFGVSGQTVRRWAQAAGVRSMATGGRSWPEATRAAAVKMVADGMSCREAAKRVGVSKDTVRRWAKAAAQKEDR